MIRLAQMARVIRSKNTSPFECALDILFKTEKIYTWVKEHQLFTTELISRIYSVPRTHVLSILYFDPAFAVKICLQRAVPSGSPGDTDVYGAQQHVPLLDLEFDMPCDTEDAC